MRYNPYARHRRLNSAIAPVRRYNGSAVDKEWETFRNDMISWANDEEAEAIRQACDANDISYREANTTVWFVYDNCPSKAEFARRFWLEQDGYAIFIEFIEQEYRDELLNCFDWNKLARFLDNIETYTIPGTDTMVGWFI
jgi:hypothetical protein